MLAQVRRRHGPQSSYGPEGNRNCTAKRVGAVAIGTRTPANLRVTERVYEPEKNWNSQLLLRSKVYLIGRLGRAQPE